MSGKVDLKLDTESITSAEWERTNCVEKDFIDAWKLKWSLYKRIWSTNPCCGFIQTSGPETDESWYADHKLTEETIAKVKWIENINIYINCRML